MLYESRFYHAVPGKFAAINDRFANMYHGLLQTVRNRDDGVLERRNRHQQPANLHSDFRQHGRPGKEVDRLWSGQGPAGGVCRGGR